MKHQYLVELDDKLLARLITLPGPEGKVFRKFKQVKDVNSLYTYIPKRIGIIELGLINMTEVKHIVYLRGDGKSTTFYFFKNNELVKLTTGHHLGYYDECRELYFFKRANQSFVVNPKYVDYIDEDWVLHFSTAIEHTIEVSEPKRKLWREISL